MRRLFRFLLWGSGVAALLAAVAAGSVLVLFLHYSRDLPDYQRLETYAPPVATRVHAGDGRLIAEYAYENRVFVPIDAIPRRVRNAFVAAEDQRFFSHAGVDFLSLLRAMAANAQNVLTDRRLIGASTITQQVAKNFLLDNTVSVERKIREAILASRIERAFTKDHILELYLNEIYLGQGAYGVAAAALTYFDKSLYALTIAETAFLAALPKAPNNYNPLRHPEAALARRNWVIQRMEEDGYISTADAVAARAEPLTIQAHRVEGRIDAQYFVEEVRRALIADYGVDKAMESGFSVRTSLDSRLQEAARQALREGLEAYDRRHGWRGPVTRVSPDGDWRATLSAVPVPPEAAPWALAMVLKTTSDAATIGLADGETGRIPLSELTWARAATVVGGLGSLVRRPADVLAPGDVVLVTPLASGTWRLRQVPEVEGALVALDPHTGRVLAMSGGWSFARNQFNRATQARRQPGSAFKPFVYLTALENGYTPATLILDAPFVMPQGPGLPVWKPENFTGRFLGPGLMRVGIEQSRNLMTVRLAQEVGMDKIVATAAQFGVMANAPPQLSIALGAGETMLLQLTAAYAAFVNGGRQVAPTLIDEIQNRRGEMVFRHDQRLCERCRDVAWTGQAPPRLVDDRPILTDPISAYQIVSMLEGVVQRGTGHIISTLKRPLAGKTGTSNDNRDAWFVGFSPDLVVGVYVGYDQPRSLGRRPTGAQETGGAVAAPIFKDFMASALRGAPVIPFRTPEGVRIVRIDAETGLLPGPGSRDTILEAFKPGTEPGSAVALPTVVGDEALPADTAAQRGVY